jgi:hypothetical protein
MLKYLYVKYDISKYHNYIKKNYNLLTFNLAYIIKSKIPRTIIIATSGGVVNKSKIPIKVNIMVIIK